eukprot:108033_1
MLYRKIYKISLGAYVLLSSLTHGSTYYVQSAPSSNYQCPSGEALCHIYCDQAEHTNHNTYDCNDAQHCYFHCDAKLCGEWSEINAANAIHLNITQAASGQQCLQFANVTTPDHGNAYLSSYAKKGFWGMNLFAGTNANQIIIDVSVMIIALLQWFKRSLRIKKRSETICGGEVTVTQQQTQPETEEHKPIPKGKRNKVVLQSTLQLTDTVMVDGDSDSDDLYMPGKEVEVETIGGDVAPKREKESDVIVIKVNHDGRGGEVDAVRSWMLETVRLPQYTDLLLRCGFDTLERCSEVTIEDLRGLGVVIGHARKIIKYTKQLREQFVE